MKLPPYIQTKLEELHITSLRPSQEKAIEAGLFDEDNLLICTPTASGKTLVGELALIHHLRLREEKKVMGVYVVPLRALASEKYESFKKRYPEYNIALTSGDMDSDDRFLERYDIIITTSEKFDSLLRHQAPWLSAVKVVIIDEIHLLNDTSRGPTLEILITLLLQRNVQLIGLSATIGNEQELANWLQAKLVHDTWRPVHLEKGIYLDGTIHFPLETDEEE